MPSILFVCTANICRSPMACALFKRRLETEPDKESWRVESAGTWAMDGEDAAPKSQAVLLEKGINLDGHKSRTVTREVLRTFDLILTMEQGQKEALQVEFPEISRRVFLFSEMAGYRYDIADPIGGSLSDFRNTANELEDLIERGFSRICQLTGRSNVG